MKKIFGGIRENIYTEAMNAVGFPTTSDSGSVLVSSDGKIYSPDAKSSGVVLQWVYNRHTAEVSVSLIENRTGWPTFIVKKKLEAKMKEYASKLRTFGVYEV